MVSGDGALTPTGTLKCQKELPHGQRVSSLMRSKICVVLRRLSYPRCLCDCGLWFVICDLRLVKCGRQSRDDDDDGSADCDDDGWW